MNKRGISPIVATLLLISFTAAVGVVIMTFGRAQVELDAECPINVGLQFSVISDVEQICYDDNEKVIKYTIQNGANIAVEGLVANVIGSQKAETFELNDAKMEKVGVYVGKISYDINEGGDIRQVKISPKIVLQGEEQTCIEKALISENVGNC